MIFFNKNVDVIFIMLGFSCNFRCKYCLQHENKSIENYNKHYNKDIIEFILKQADNNKDRKLMVQFFGGEPLLYIETIKSIINDLKHHKNIGFSTITNGSLITKELAEFIDENDIQISISWDGRTSNKSRLIDVFKTNKENIFSLKKGFDISGVLNHYNNSPRKFFRDVQKIREEYKKYHNHDDYLVGYNIDNLYNFLDSDEDIYKLDFNILKKDMNEIIYNFIHDPKKNLSIENEYAQTFFYRLKIFNENTKEFFSRCGCGLSMLNLDLEGNLYLCHNNAEKKLGSIYDTIDSYLIKYKEYNNILSRRANYCDTCSVRFLCFYGCVLCDITENCSYCQQQKAIYTPVIETIINSAFSTEE